MPQSNASLVSKKTSVTNFDFLVENMPNICCLRTQTRFFSFVSSSFNFVWFTFAFPELTFSKVEEYAQKESGRRHTTKGYKFLLSLDIYTIWKTSFLIVRKSIPNAEMGFENDVSICLQIYKFYIGTRIFLKRGSSWHSNKGKKASKTATTTAVERPHIGAPAIEGLSCAWLFLLNY